MKKNLLRDQKSFCSRVGKRPGGCSAALLFFSASCWHQCFQQKKVKWFFEVLLGCSINSHYVRWPMKMGSLAHSDLLHILYPDPTLFINCYFVLSSLSAASPLFTLSMTEPLHFIWWMTIQNVWMNSLPSNAMTSNDFQDLFSLVFQGPESFMYLGLVLWITWRGFISFQSHKRPEAIW